MAIQNIITGDFKIRNENGILIAVDGIVFADTSGTIGTSGTSGTSGSSTILFGTSGTVIVIPGTPTTTTTAAPTTTTTASPTTTTTTVAPTTTTTTVAPTTTTTTVAFTSFYLQFSSLSQANACAIYPGDLNEYFIAFGASLQNGTILYSDSALTTPVINGYYSDGFKSWLTTINNGVLANETSCTTTTTTTAAPTTTTTTVAPTTTTTTAAPTTTTTTVAVIPMIMTFNVANNGDSITLPYSPSGTYSGTINWGDGNVTVNSYANRTHTYATAGNYDVSIGGICSVFSFAFLATSANRIKDIKQWGNIYNTSYNGMFYYCNNLTGISATDLPIFPPNANLQTMFQGCTLLGTTTTNMNSWNMANVIAIDYMFILCTNFNVNISSWNVSNVTNMQSAFSNATLFNQNISSWNVSNVTNMISMFSGATSFNQDLSGWCVTNIPTAPINFSLGATAWALPKPVWGTCP